MFIASKSWQRHIHKTVIAHNKSKTFKFQNYEKNKHFSYRGSLVDKFIYQQL